MVDDNPSPVQIVEMRLSIRSKPDLFWGALTLITLLLFTLTATAQPVSKQGSDQVSDSQQSEAVDTADNGPASVDAETRGSVPEGFEELSGPQTAYLDVYYAGENVGGTIAIFTIEEVTFPEPSALVDLIPDVTDRQAVIAELTGPLESNWRLLCRPGQTQNCGRLTPQVAGVILDSDRFRVDLFLAPDYLETQRLDDVRYLPVASGDLAVTADLSHAFSGTEGQPGSNLTSTSRADIIAGRGDLRAEGLITHSDSRKTRVERLGFVAERESLRSEGGFLRSRGSQLVSEVEFYGGRFQTTTDLRVDLEISQATPIELFFDRRSRVEILRDGQLLSIDFYEAGNRQLNVSTLPSGAYQILIRVFEGPRLVREEQRFFVKSNRFPPRDTIMFTAEGGALAAGSIGQATETVFPRGTEDWIGHAGLAMRLRDDLAIGADLYGTEEFASLGANVIFLAEGLNAEAALQAGDDKSWSALAQINYGVSTFAASLTARINRDGDYQPLATNLARGFFDPVTDDFSRVTGSLSWRKGPLRLGGRVEYLQTGRGASRTETISYLPNASWLIAQRGGRTVDLSAAANITKDDWAATLRLTFRQQAGRWSLSADNLTSVDRRRRDIFDSTSVSASWRDDELFEDEITGNLVLRHTQPGRRIASARGTYIGDFLQASGTVEHEKSQGQNQTSTNYSGTLRTGLAGNRSGVSFTGRPRDGGAIIIDLTGDVIGQPFEVLVNGRVHKTQMSGTRQPLFLDGYKMYQLRLRAKQPGNYQFDARARDVALYPGSVVVLNWAIDDVVPVFGRIVDEQGKAVALARIETDSTQDFSDDFGYFVINISRSDQELQVSSKGVQLCAPKLPEIDFTKDLVRIGDIVCPLDRDRQQP